MSKCNRVDLCVCFTGSDVCELASREVFRMRILGDVTNSNGLWLFPRRFAQFLNGTAALSKQHSQHWHSLNCRLGWDAVRAALVRPESAGHGVACRPFSLSRRADD